MEPRCLLEPRLSRSNDGTISEGGTRGESFFRLPEHILEELFVLVVHQGHMSLQLVSLDRHRSEFRTALLQGFLDSSVITSVRSFWRQVWAFGVAGSLGRGSLFSEPGPLGRTVGRGRRLRR